MWDKLIPKDHCKIVVRAADNGNKVVLQRPYCPLCGVSSVDLGWCKLKLHCLFVQVVDERCGALIVQFLEAWAQYAQNQEPMRVLVCQKYPVYRAQ